MRFLASIKYFVGRNARYIPFLPALRRMIAPPGDAVEFQTSDQYWKDRYKKGGNSGEGSYGPLARYKAEFINDFCRRNGVGSAVEFGCGDGNQASMLDIRSYLGVDISEDCIEWARKNIRKPNWRFETLAEYLGSEHEAAELGLSLDVIYHLVEDETYASYLQNLCDSASRFLLIYASNLDAYNPEVPHVRHRTVIADVERLHPQWGFVRTEQNPLAIDHDNDREYGSFAHFHVFEKRAA